MRYINHIFFYVLLVAVISCNKSSPDCFKKAGKDSKLERTLSPFKIVQLETNIEITLVKGADYKVEIFGGENLLEKVKTSVESGTLIIDNGNSCNFVRGYDDPIKVTVTAPKYDNVITNSVGSIITNADFQQDTMFFRSEGGDIKINGTYTELKTSSHGNGNVYFSGTTTNMYVYMNGTNYLFASEGVVTNYLFVSNISLGNAHVNLANNGTLEYHISKTGNIYYKGDPAVIKGKSDGKGTILKE
jgi:hypothetical protein